MIKLDFNFNIIGLNGQPAKDQFGKEIHAGQFLANSLVSQTNGDIVKYMDWALAMHNGKPINVDMSDSDKLKEFIEEHKSMAILVKSQLIEVLKQKK